MSFLETIEEFAVTRMLGKGAIAAATALASSKIIAVLAAHGVSVSIDPSLVSAAVVGAVHMAINWYKNRKK